MQATENLLEALKSHKIEVVSADGNHIRLHHDFEIEVEANGLYKLFDDGYIVAPFSDVHELCRFILK